MTDINTYIPIGELAKKAHVSLQTLRRWDRVGQLKPAMQLRNGTRLYTPEQVRECIESRKEELKRQLAMLDESEI